MKQHLTFVLLLLAVAAGALAFRLPRLDNRPMHADEAVQASIFRKLWLQGTYVYDPLEYHGPTLPYATLPAVWAAAPQSFSETSEATYRIVPVAFGAGMILLFGLLYDAVGRAAVLIAGLLAAISPAMVFYNRYFIHETVFVFFALAMIASAWRYVRSGNLAWCIAAGASAGLMQATKETSVLTFAAAGTALVFSWGWNRLVPPAAKTARPRIHRAHLAWGGAAFLFVTVTLLSSFFTNLRGPWDGVLTYLHWMRRAGGQSPHVQPWYYFVEILAYWKSADGAVWSEGFILVLALIGIGVTVLRTGRRPGPPASVSFARWLALYALLLTSIYTLLPYKTPWCLLGFHQALILLAGLGAVAVFPKIPRRVWKADTGKRVLALVFAIVLQVMVAVVFAAASVHLAWQAYRASYVLYADSGNPYVHTPTAPKIEQLVQDLDELAQAAPERYSVHVQVVWSDPYYWPLPWYLRRFDQVGYWTQVPEGPGAPIVVSSPQLDAALTEKLDETHLMTGYYAVRPNVLAQLWVRMDLWEAHLRRLGRL